MLLQTKIRSTLAFIILSAVLTGCGLKAANQYLFSDGGSVSFTLGVTAPKAGEKLTFNVVAPTIGKIEQNERVVTYTPPPGFNGRVQILYSVTNGINRSNNATIFIRVLNKSISHPFDNLLRLNHIQMKGTHNSYHVHPNVAFHPSHQYTQKPLYEQLDQQGVRAFELDLHRNSIDGSLQVYHIVLIDEKTTCRKFTDCLSAIRSWSDHNPDHSPLFVWIEAKDSTGGQRFDSLAQIDAAIREILDDRLLEPDDIKGEYNNVREAINQRGWPTLGEVRGKIMFGLINSKEFGEDYTAGWQHLNGRAMFVSANSEQFTMPWAAVSKINNPMSETIAAAHDHHLLIASNICLADASDEECEARMQAGLNNGVHMMKDDFPGPTNRRHYYLNFKDGNPLRCNTVTAPAFCTSQAIESIY